MDEINSLLILIFGGLILRFSLTATGQAWAKSHAQTVAFMILPVITYVITKTISGNIALSLGMIGALSIVRFRHPVKSALELIMYFDLITIGIATSVRTKWAIQLVVCTIIILIVVKIVNGILKKRNKNFFNISFNEGNELNTLEVYSSVKNEMLESNENLKNSIKDQENNEFIYRFVFQNKDHLNKFKETVEKEENIKKIEVQFV